MICHKIKYHDKIAAMFALSECKFLKKRGNRNRKEIKIYFCDKCNSYHLTSKK